MRLNRLKPLLRGIWTATKIAFRIRKGYGVGMLSTYIPWIGVRDLSSKGTSTRMWSHKTGRMMQFLSNIERDTFLIAEFREDFIDWWEQWPIERHRTKLAAETLRFRHPIYVGSTEPVVMTVDAISVRRLNGGVHYSGIDCKHSSALDDRRTLEKLAITRVALEGRNLTHRVVTQKSIKPRVVKNILWVRLALRRAGELETVPGLFEHWPMRLHKQLARDLSAEPQTYSRQPLFAYCKAFDAANRLPAGSGLRCMKLLMWQHLVEFDLRVDKPAKLMLGQLTVRDVPTLVPAGDSLKQLLEKNRLSSSLAGDVPRD